MIRVCVISALYVVYAVLALQAIASSAVLHLYLSTVVTDDVARRLEHSVILILVAVPILATTTGVLAWKKAQHKARCVREPLYAWGRRMPACGEHYIC